MARARLDWIDAARGVAFVGVVVNHMILVTRQDIHVSTSLVRLNDIMDGFRMPTLVGISGMLTAGIGTWAWSEVWRRRAGPLLLIYAAWAVVIAVLEIVLEGGVSKHVHVMGVAIIVPSNTLWYLLALPIYFLVARLARSVPTSVMVVASLAVFVVVRHEWQWSAAHLGSLAWVLAHWVYFVCAERFAAGYRRVAEESTPARAWSAIALFAVLAAASVWGGVVTSVAMLSLLSIGGTLVGFACAGVWGSARWLGWAREIGRRSLGMYATHAVIGTVVWLYLGPHVPPFTGGSVLVPLGLTAASLAIAYGVTLALARWAPVPLLRPWWSTAERKVESVPQAQ